MRFLFSLRKCKEMYETNVNKTVNDGITLL